MVRLNINLIKSLVIAAVMVAASSKASAISYLCIPDESAGFYKDKDGVFTQTKFTTPDKYIIEPIGSNRLRSDIVSTYRAETGDEPPGSVVKIFGGNEAFGIASIDLNSPSDGQFFIGHGLSEKFVMNPKNGRYQYYSTITGYVFDSDASMFIEIGKCESF